MMLPKCLVIIIHKVHEAAGRRKRTCACKCCAQGYIYKQFLKSGTVGVLDQIILHSGCPLCYRIFSSIPVLHTLEPPGVSPLSDTWSVSSHCQMFPGGRSPRRKVAPKWESLGYDFMLSHRPHLFQDPVFWDFSTLFLWKLCFMKSDTSEPYSLVFKMLINVI